MDLVLLETVDIYRSKHIILLRLSEGVREDRRCQSLV